MKSRLLVAAVGIPLLLVILLLCPPIVTAIAVALLSGIGANELLNTTGLLKHKRMLVYSELMAVMTAMWSFVMACGWFVDLGLGQRGGWLLGAAMLFVFVLALYVEALAAYPQVPFSGITGSVFAGVLIPLSLSAIARLETQELGRYYVLIPILVPFIADAGAYFAGMACGKHKLAPVLSPKKTIEGAVGGLVSGVLGMVIYCLIMQLCFHRGVNYGFAAIYGIMGSVISIIGDLSFSMVKRETGIKDYGTLFRAHGGVLDRFDSVIFSAPLIEMLLLVLPAVF